MQATKQSVAPSARESETVRLGDGRIVAANSGMLEIRYYDPEGRHLLTVGRNGEGHGEFRTISSIWALRDHLLPDPPRPRTSHPCIRAAHPAIHRFPATESGQSRTTT